MKNCWRIFLIIAVTEIFVLHHFGQKEGARRVICITEHMALSELNI